MRKLRYEEPKKYRPSKTIPGQALIPAELLKRHLAGTLPDLQKNPQFTHDDEGRPTGEQDLSRLELHELHELAQQVKSEFIEREKELAKQESENYRKSVIDDYIKTQTVALEKPPGTAAVSATRDGAAADSGMP